MLVAQVSGDCQREHAFHEGMTLVVTDGTLNPHAARALSHRAPNGKPA